MIRYVEFPAEQTAEIASRLTAAGRGATLRVVLGPTENADGIKFSIDIRTPANRDAAAEDCDEPVNKSHTCPPTC